MITVKILGGLGNQLYAFACGYSMAKRLNKELVLDVADYYNGYMRPYALDGLNIPVCNKLTYTHASYKMLTPEVLPAQVANTFDIIADESAGLTNRDALYMRIHQGNNIYLHGYWGSFDFFSGYEDDIRSLFKPLNPSDVYIRFLETIRGQCSVAIHLRRTDFVLLANNSGDNYYRAAIAYIQSIHPEARFYFFSDDIDYAKEHFGNKEHFRYIQIFGGMDADLDEFFCISACNHRILSRRSSFSEWASFLNNSHHTIDVIHCPKGSPSQQGFVCLNDETIGALNAKYDQRPRFDIKSISQAKLYLEDLVSKSESHAIMNIINDISLDAYSVNRTDSGDFLAMKAIASAQTGNLIAAEQCLHKQSQYVREDDNFQANCHFVFNALGKTKESVMHAALCAKLTKHNDLRSYFDQSFIDSPLDNDLYVRIRDCPPMHFIIAPNSAWFYYIKTPQSIAVLLSKMGHTVSYILPPVIKDIEPGTSSEQIVNACLEAKFSCDSIYSYGLHSYPSILGNTAGRTTNYVEALIEHLSRTISREAVVLFRHPQVVPDLRERKYAKYIYWDIQDESDSERMYVTLLNEDIREYMCRRADHSIITDRNFYTKTQRDWQLNNTRLFQYPQAYGNDHYKYIKERISYTPNYLADDRTIALAAFILELSMA